MYCTRCGTEVDDGANFCPKCGAPIAEMHTRQDSRQSRESSRQGGDDQAERGGQSVDTENTNVYAIVGFVLSFFFAVIGLVLGIMGYKKSKLLMDSGKGFSIAAIVISLTSIAVTLTLIIGSAIYMELR